MGLKMKIKNEKSFYCAEFVKHVLDKAKIKTELPDLVKPEDFKQIKNMKLEYDGLLKFYKYYPKMILIKSKAK